VLTLVIIFLLIKKFNKKKASLESPDKAYKIAISSLDETTNLTNPIEIATSVSLILRKYLSSVFSNPSLFETHEEFISRHDALTGIKSSSRQMLSSHFDNLVKLKYAPNSAPFHKDQLLMEARQLLQQLNS
jgi:hypothetical protein